MEGTHTNNHNTHTHTNIHIPTPPYLSSTDLNRRRIGRGGRVVLDRQHPVNNLFNSCLEEKRTENAGGNVGGGRDAGGVRPRTPPHLQFVEWDPYKVGRIYIYIYKYWLVVLAVISFTSELLS